MALSINTNIAAMNAQRNLGKTQGMLSKSLGRLSSGLRINSAKDDAAGLGISNRMNAQIRGLNQAARNANDGISLAQTAEGALGESTNILQRMRELAVQSANDTNTGADRQSLQSEIDQLIAELDRIATTTSFNGKTLLDGTFTTANFHVGANANQSISMSVSGARASQIGSIVNQAGAESVTITDGLVETATAATRATYLGVMEGTGSDGSNLSINGSNIVASSTYGTDATAGLTSGSAYALSQAINASNVSGVSSTADNTQVWTEASADNFLVAAEGTDAGETFDYTLSINGVTVIDSASLADGDTVTLEAAAAGINSQSSDTGVVATVLDGELQLQASDGRDIIIEEDFTGNDATTADGSVITVFSAYDETAAAGVYDATFRGQVTLNSSESISISAGSSMLGYASTLLEVDSSSSIATLDVSNVDGANSAIMAVDAALSSLDSSRGELGALQNRFESTIANLQNVSENLSAARSRILDADFAAETANLTKAQILQQAGVAMLSQANQLPQTVLSLLQ